MKNMNETKELVFEKAVYSPEAVELAAHIFSARCALEVKAGKSETRVILKGEGLEQLAGELANEALNQQCRMDLAKKNSKIAGMIVTKALLSAAGAKKK